MVSYWCYDTLYMYQMYTVHRYILSAPYDTFPVLCTTVVRYAQLFIPTYHTLHVRCTNP
jgi:hypothetical protein